MGLFNFFKRRNDKAIITTDEGLNQRTSEPSKDTADKESNPDIYNLAFASIKYSELNSNYQQYKIALYDFGYADDEFIFNTVGLTLQFFYANEKAEAKKLYGNLSADFPNDENVIWLFIEVICLINLPDSQEFVSRYMNHKKQKHDFNYQYEVEYQKGLELKSLKFYSEAIGLFESLNKIQLFAWNYYQVFLIKNLMGKEKEIFDNLIKAIELDGAIKEDAKTYFELDNLRDHPKFMEIVR